MYRDDLYRDPGLYDLEYERQTDDVVYYVKEANRHGGPILELGCGNGRITLPLARSGHTVHGLDLSRDMLADLRAKLADEPEEVRGRVTVEQGSFLDLDGTRQYPLIILPFNALHHCERHTDVLALLRGVRACLAPGGHFLLDCYLPDPALYRRNPKERYEERTFIDPRTGTALTSWERGWYDPIAQIHHVLYEYEAASGQHTHVHLELRMFYPQELYALLDWGGFRVVKEASDFDGTPLSALALKWVADLVPADP